MQQTNNIKETLLQRGGRYGSIEDNAIVTQGLMEVLQVHGKNYTVLTNVHIECVRMIFHKISRMVSGDPYYIDNVHDIVGYAQLLEDWLKAVEANAPFKDLKTAIDTMNRGKK